MRKRRRARRQRRGAVLILMAVLFPVLAMMAAFAVDVAWMQLVRTELRTATDAASRAGAKELSLRQNIGQARAAAIDAASRNAVAGPGLRLASGDIKFGTSRQSTAEGRFQFTSGGTPINAVHVDGLRTIGSLSGPVRLFFGGVLGVTDFQPQHDATSTMLDRDICLVIDRSGSMGLDLATRGDLNGQNCGPLDARTRFAALVQAVADFGAELERTLPRERVALASYSSETQINCSPQPGFEIDFEIADIRQQLTSDFSRINAVMNSFMQRGIGGSTAIGSGLAKGIEAIRGAGARPFAVRNIVLMTDGLHNTGIDPVTVARTATAEGIVVFTVTFSQGADQTRMRRVADETGGRHFHADTAADLRASFREIARTIPVLITD
jgi:hypothetical protein